jgi:hypothetical protein
MRTERLAALSSYVADMQARMGLVQWQIRVGESRIKGLLAKVDPCEGRYWARLTVHRKSFWRLSPEEQRNSVVHELVHLVHQPATRVIEYGKWREDLALPVWRDVHSEFVSGVELMTDHLANVFSPLMPLPPEWPK